MSEIKETTKVSQEEISPAELNDLLDIPGAESALTPEEEKPGFFSAGAVDLSFITKKEPIKKADSKDPKKEDEDTPEATADTVKEIIEEVDPDPSKVTEDPNKGRPKINKDAAVELTKKLIEKKILTPFDDDKAVEDYTLADFEELFEANMKDKEDKLRQEVPVEFFDSLPEEMQYAAQYVANGGKDLKGLFKALGEVMETRELSEKSPEDQETIVREYLLATNFGSDEDITEEITSWKDLGKLPEKAEKFKPKLDQLREEQIANKLARQEAETRQKAEAARAYTSSIYETLKPSEIGGLKLDKKTQGMLYSGLVQSQYPSLSGKSTNMLGHLLEKYQFVEPNHSLIAEVLWLLADRDGYHSKVKEQSKTETTEAIVRKLKTEEGKKTGSTSQNEREDSKMERKIPRNVNFFKR